MILAPEDLIIKQEFMSHQKARDEERILQLNTEGLLKDKEI